MNRYYRRDGTPYPDDGLFEWAKDFGDIKKKIVKQTALPNGNWVSTVWLGLNHNYGEGKPLIFETMVFSNKDDGASDLFQERYSTEQEAIDGHERACLRFGKGKE